MIDTNTINAATATAAAAQTTFNAWHVVAALAAGTLVHAYHVIVNGGGVVRLLSNFWNGPAQPLAARVESTIPIVAHEVTSAGAGGVAGTPPESPIGNPKS